MSDYSKRLSARKLIIIAVLLLCFISLLTKYNGTGDVGDYANVAKFFAGSYAAKLRASHNLLYGLMLSPLMFLSNSFVLLKLPSLLFMILIMISIYYISGKDKRTLLLFIFSPIVWFMGPWISPIQLSSLLFLWGFFFLEKYNENSKKPYLFYSGILIGLSVLFWNPVMFILFFLLICFFYRRNINHLVLFILSVFIGLTPLLIFDKLYYGMAFYSLIKYLLAALSVFLYKGIYSLHHTPDILFFLSFFLMIPFFIYTLFMPNFFRERKRQIIFLLFSLLFLLFNPQIRYTLLLYPIIILYLSQSLNHRQFKIQILIFFIISILVVTPYLVQIKYSTNSRDFPELVGNIGNWKIISDKEAIINDDLNAIVKEYPNTIFLVGNAPDDYAYLAEIYNGNRVKEFISIQDYNLVMENKTVLFEKKIISQPKIRDRRQIWLAVGIGKNENDDTDYKSINLGIGIDEPINSSNFTLVKKYNVLYLSQKTGFNQL